MKYLINYGSTLSRTINRSYACVRKGERERERGEVEMKRLSIDYELIINNCFLIIKYLEI